MSNIPPMGSIPPGVRNRQRVRTDSTMRRTIDTHRRDGSNVKPTIVRNGRQITRRPTSPQLVLPSWPDRAEPEVIEYENHIWVMVEFPRHPDIRHMKWTEEDDVLSVRSTLLSCPYINQIALPQDRGERVNIKLNNGLFVVTFERQYPL